MVTFNDTFTRADGALGTGWTADSDTTNVTPPVIVSNDAVCPSGIVYCGAFRSETFGADQTFEVVTSTLTADGNGGDYHMRVTGTTMLSYTGYVFYWYSSGGSIFIGIGKNVAGAFTAIGGELAKAPGGDMTLRLELQGSTQRLYYNGTLQQTTTDSAIASGTKIALDIYRTSGASTQVPVRSVQGGDFTTGSSVSGTPTAGAATSTGAVVMTRRVTGAVTAGAATSTGVVTDTGPTGSTVSGSPTAGAATSTGVVTRGRTVSGAVTTGAATSRSFAFDVDARLLKGVAVIQWGLSPDIGADLTTLNIDSWWYDWGNYATTGQPLFETGQGVGDNVPGWEYVPMCWGDWEHDYGYDLGNEAPAAAVGPSPILLGFNEPDEASQSNVTVARALALWPQLEATGARLGSPAVSGSGGGLAWLASFMSGNGGPAPRVDFMCVHWYVDYNMGYTNVGDFLDFIRTTYGKPIWITEAGHLSGGLAANTSLIPTVMAAATARAWVERIAWFSARDGGAFGGGTGLLNTDGTKNSAGTVYASYAPRIARAGSSTVSGSPTAGAATSTGVAVMTHQVTGSTTAGAATSTGTAAVLTARTVSGAPTAGAATSTGTATAGSATARTVSSAVTAGAATSSGVAVMTHKVAGATTAGAATATGFVRSGLPGPTIEGLAVGKVRLGANQVDRVYVGSYLAWPP